MASSNIISILLYLSPVYRTHHKATIKASTSVKRGYCKERNTSLSDICITFAMSHSVDWTTLLPKLFKTYEMPATATYTPSAAWKNYDMGTPLTVTGLDPNATYTLIASTPFTEGKGEFRLKITGATTYQQNTYNSTGVLVALAYQIHGIKPASSGSLTFQRAYSGEIVRIRADKLYITLIRTA